MFVAISLRPMLIREQLPSQGLWLFRWRSYLPLLFVPIFAVALLTPRTAAGRWGVEWDLACKVAGVLVAALGQFVRILTVGRVPEGTSGRNTKHQLANSLNTTGIYSVVQHPLYLGNFLCFLGMAVYPGVWWLAVIAALCFWVYYERIMLAEETFLAEKFGEAHAVWARRTPVFLPRLSQWRAGDLPYSVRTVLKREYSGVFLLVLYFAGYEIARRAIDRAGSPVAPAAALGVGLLFYLTMRTLKKRTGLLRVTGR